MPRAKCGKSTERTVDYYLIEYTGRQGRPTDEALRGAVGDLKAGTWVATDAHRGYERVLPALGITEHATTGSRLQRDGELGMADALH